MSGSVIASFWWITILLSHFATPPTHLLQGILNPHLSSLPPFTTLSQIVDIDFTNVLCALFTKCITVALFLAPSGAVQMRLGESTFGGVEVDPVAVSDIEVC